MRPGEAVLVANAGSSSLKFEAFAAGYREMELTATLSGVPLYLKRGYRTQKKVEMILPGGIAFPGLMMRKDLGEVQESLGPSLARA